MTMTMTMRKTPVRWTVSEETALRSGVQKYGPGRWKTILDDQHFFPLLARRTNVDLKDKWRNLTPKSSNRVAVARIMRRVEARKRKKKRQSRRRRGIVSVKLFHSFNGIVKPAAVPKKKVVTELGCRPLRLCF